MTLSGGGKVKRGRMNSSLSFSFRRMHFYFSISYVLVRKTRLFHFFPPHILTALASNLQNFFLAFFPTHYSLGIRAQLTQKFSSPSLRSLARSSFHPCRRRHQTKKTGKVFSSKAKRLFTFILVC